MSERLTDDELVAMERRHEESENAPEGKDHVCLTCWQRWPCDAHRLLDHARSLAEAAEVGRAVARLPAGAFIERLSKGWIIWRPRDGGGVKHSTIPGAIVAALGPSEGERTDG